MICSGPDPFVTNMIVDDVTSRFANVRKEVVPNAGRLVHIEQARADANLLGHFIEDAVVPLVIPKNSAAREWKGAFGQHFAASFADAFAKDVMLEATALRLPISERDNAKRVMKAAIEIYESLEFSEQALSDYQQYIEWRVCTFVGLEPFGVTMIIRDASGGDLSRGDSSLRAAWRYGILRKVRRTASGCHRSLHVLSAPRSE
jgi:hypothetical protein